MGTSIRPLRADLHCHSMASNEADEALLNAINCPESYSDPIEVYEQAKSRGMNFVTLTDHDSIEGVSPLVCKGDVIIGEEVTCYFPEDRCKIHLLVWGLTKADHDAMQAVADDIYKVAEYVEKANLAHAVAHPVYRQNDVLELWHLERLALMFKGFECLNGAHSMLHRDALEPFVDGLSEERIETLSRRHGMAARWPEPWIKARTGGSDDHGLFNIGRTWTEFPADATTIPAVLQCIREARCKPGGEAGNSMKLAHNFFSVGIRYFARQIAEPGSPAATMLGVLTGERQPRWKVYGALARTWVDGVRTKIGRVITRRKYAKAGTDLLSDAIASSISRRMAQHASLRDAVSNRRAPLAEHEAMFNLVQSVNRDVARTIQESISHGAANGDFAAAFNSLSAVAAHQAILAPYYFALFHQNRERHVLGRVTGLPKQVTGQAMKLGEFTDVLDEPTGTSRFIRTMSEQAERGGFETVVHTSGKNPGDSVADRKNFEPLISLPMPFYPQSQLTVPPPLEVLEWADRRQFDAIHVHTIGPMGLCGKMVASMLRAPLIATCHLDFPASVFALTGDFRLTSGAQEYARWFYSGCTAVLCRSRASMKAMEKLGIASDKLHLLPPSVDMNTFNPEQRDLTCWDRLGIREAHKVLFVGRLSSEKNLMMLAESFKKLCAIRRDTALVFVGEGPLNEKLQKALAGLPAYFLGNQQHAELKTIYASADLLVSPSKNDTMGQAAMEAQASGLPVLVSEEGGPQEIMDDELTGLKLPAGCAVSWCSAMNELLSDEARRQRMSRTAASRMARYTPEHAFEVFWDVHVKATIASAEQHSAAPATAAPVAESVAATN